MTDITTEAVEAAARAVHARAVGPRDAHLWDELAEWERDVWRGNARATLAAAAPIIAAQATADLRTGIETLRDEWRERADAAFAAYPNPIGTRDGFPRGYASAQSVLDARNLRRTHEMYLEDHR